MHSKLTLAILLVVLMCQILATGSAFSVQYSDGEHPMGIDVNHHHVHGVSESSGSSGDTLVHGHENTAFNATEPVLDFFSEPVSEPLEAEHEHANHSHTPSHPPVEAVFMTSFFQSETLVDDDISYLNLRYAPPIPPPHT
ncbi:hypothetical protein EKG38_15720 [Shewanella canadensis]|uniref:Cobalt transporter n=1 Tax=Shewanella canadensis TaxID=271096 RepID=A0A431WRD9_9GAMM|nr:hypothetical protein [Shewanella canadensis]RTR38011.1 hypothetical protein EKG38_15720 [Shewanella canadensis]